MTSSSSSSSSSSFHWFVPTTSCFSWTSSWERERNVMTAYVRNLNITHVPLDLYWRPYQYMSQTRGRQCISEDQVFRGQKSEAQSMVSKRTTLKHTQFRPAYVMFTECSSFSPTILWGGVMTSFFFLSATNNHQHSCFSYKKKQDINRANSLSYRYLRRGRTVHGLGDFWCR